ncbi:glycoside hydrolase family 6 protein [Subtercola sp. PAMC28395]|uniref:glycoside hydrolase family 6 protein n=1 Tax=Subtercola sp. PAMC28395 TaxID=2846775 RepID=UPI001C0E8279|nr:glycoside hydrolase family 6 protein [Subtercola sp. PAMC28395]QWT24861.1 glycoside hydrolase family 6 protein [Subtercola sp. PAMC28395]
MASAIVALFIPIVALGVILSAVANLASPTSAASTASGALQGKTFYVDPEAKAAIAAAAAASKGNSVDAATFGRIADQPTAIWLTPEKHSTAEITAYVSAIEKAATAANQTPIFTVYGVPNRDCGNHSAGGLSATEYPLWVKAIAAGITHQNAVIILEPDALALATQCNNVSERVKEISSDLDIFAPVGATVYIDAGHSQWGPAADMAALLNQAGVTKARGFATNVSNYNDTAAEQTYAETISSLTGGAHFVIDTSRNGRGSNGEWCNPSGRALGAVPSKQDVATNQDANLWIKPPGESDGTCNGGPTAGEWWDQSARELASNAGW